MEDIAEHLQKSHGRLKQMYHHVSLKQYDQAYECALDALFFVRASILWLKHKQEKNQE